MLSERHLILIRSREINHIITTSPPHSTQLIGLQLKKRYPGIKWIADLRDPWTDIYYYDHFYPTFISKSIDRYYEKEVLTNADQIITVGNNLAKTFISKIEGLITKFISSQTGTMKRTLKESKSSVPDKIYNYLCRYSFRSISD